MVKVLVLTGQRRDEVARMEWSEIDFGHNLWTLPRERVKNDEKHEVPLSGAAVAVLKSGPRIAGSRYVFTTSGQAPSSGYSKGKRRLDASLSDMPPWRLHDLRRTTASGMARLGINLPVIEKVLNHASGSFAGIVGVYQKHEFSQEKRHALDAWGAFVAGLAGDRPRKHLVRRRSAQSS
jgi:integrase